MNNYIIVETIFGKEYKVAMLSHRYISDALMYMLLADVYYLGEIEENSPKTARVNKFTTFELAEKAVKELRNPISQEEKA